MLSSPWVESDCFADSRTNGFALKAMPSLKTLKKMEGTDHLSSTPISCPTSHCYNSNILNETLFNGYLLNALNEIQDFE